jgi:phosphoglycerate kinase
MPSDVAYVDAQRREVLVTSLLAEGLIVDIGCETAERYAEIVSSAGTVFANGPMGVFEQDESEHGTEIVWTAIAESSAYTVIGGGDSIAAVNKYGLAGKFGYVSTAGGGMVRFISGEELPVIRALKKAALKYTRGEYGARQN